MTQKRPRRSPSIRLESAVGLGIRDQSARPFTVKVKVTRVFGPGR